MTPPPSSVDASKELPQALEHQHSSVSWRFVMRRLFALTKPTITFLVVVTAVPTLFMAPFHGSHSSFVAVALLALLGTGLAAASASVFNHLLDRDIDEVMLRTKKRPVASGDVSVPVAFTWGAVLGIASLVVLYVAHPLAAIIGFLANAFYVLIYTLILKRSTDQNIVIGGAAGSVGPLIGWAAIAGTVSWEAWVLFGLIFLWTPPHFWALALKYQNDYRDAGIPMRPVTAGNPTARREIFLYTLPLLPCCLALCVFGDATWFFGVVAIWSTGIFIRRAWRLYRSGDNATAMPVFYYSCFYLFIIFGALTIDAVLVDVLRSKGFAAVAETSEKPTVEAGKAADIADQSPDVRLQKTLYGARSGEIIVHFSAGVLQDLPVVVRPLSPLTRVRRAQPTKVEFEFVNLSDAEVAIEAIHRLRPAGLEDHLKKLSCFCFDKQVLKPRERQVLPVVLTLDQELPWDITELNLHYGVFPVREGGVSS